MAVISLGQGEEEVFLERNRGKILEYIQQEGLGMRSSELSQSVATTYKSKLCEHVGCPFKTN